MNIGVILAGSGVYDGSEIHEAVFTLLAIDELGHSAHCFAPDKPQHHVVNHTNGEEMDETRNVLVESARIARGAIQPLSEAKADALDALIIPGGFGAAKNLNQWALAGPEGAIDPEVKALILAMHQAGKPIGALCMGPTVLAKALEGSGVQATLTVGTTKAPSPYDIKAISEGMESLGAKAEMQPVDGITIDQANKLVTGPCYMMEASIRQIRDNAKQVVEALVKL